MDKEIKRKRDPSESICGKGINPPPSNGKKTKGRVKIKTEFIENKLRRYTTFSKRKTGIMKKAHELSILTGTQVMLLVASETGHVYTFATKKLQPMITSEAGKALIKTCLNSPDKGEGGKEEGDQRMCAEGFEETEIVYEVENKDKLWNMEAESDPAESGAAGMKNEYEESYDDPGSDDGDSESDLPTNLSMNKRSTDSDLNDYSNNISMPKRVPDTESFNYTTSNKPNTKGSTMLSERQPIITSVQSLNPRLSPPLALSNNPNLTASTLGNNGRKIPLFPQGIQLSELTAAGLLQAPHLPAEVLAQLGYTTLLAQAQAHHQQQQQQQQQSNASTTSQLPHHAQQKIFTNITTSNLSPHPQILNSHTTSHSLPTAVVSAMTGPPRFSYVLPPESQAPINSLVGYQLRPTGGNSAPLSPAASEMMPENLSLHDKHS